MHQPVQRSLCIRAEPRYPAVWRGIVSAATNLRPSYSIRSVDPNGPTRDIYLWNSRSHGGAGNVSRESRPGVKGEFNAPSVQPAMSSHGNYLAFASDEVGQLSGTGSALPNILMRFLGGK
jgi:hypothetical protein